MVEAVIKDKSFDRYARMAQRALGVPTALVCFIEETRETLPGAAGLAEPLASTREVPLEDGVCRLVLGAGGLLAVGDVRGDPRTRHVRAPVGLDLVAYAGIALRDARQRAVGVLCVVDDQPHAWTQAEVDALDDLAEACSAEIAQRRFRGVANERSAIAEHATRQARLLLRLSESLSTTQTVMDISTAVEEVAIAELGCTHAGIWLRSQASLDAAVRSSAPALGQAESLRYAGNPDTDWEAATAYAVLPLDQSNPPGAVVLSGEPVYLGHRSEQAARYPGLKAVGPVDEGRAVLPLVVGGRTLGALALLWRSPRPFAGSELDVFTGFARYIAQAVQRALLLEERIDVALTLQNAMLGELPRAEAMEMVARYRPASARNLVGGDWYDAICLPDGKTALMIGDVVGHDIEAASRMALIRSILRTLTWQAGEPPSARLTQLDQASRDIADKTMASLLLASLDPLLEGQEKRHGHVARQVTWSNAGHLPPLIVRRDGGVDWLGDLHSSGDLMLGVDDTWPRRDHIAHMHAGDTLLLYTDGLVERRGEDLDQGIARLADAAHRRSRLALPQFIDHVLDDLIEEHPDDDTAVLAVRLAG